MSSHSSALRDRHHQPILACQQVTKVFHANQQAAFTALEGINLDVARGDFVTILGRSGGGKSTLLKLLGGFIPPSSGQVLFHGVPLSGITSKIGMVFQENTLYPWLTVEQNVISHRKKEGLMRKPSKTQDYAGKRAGGEHPVEAMSSKRWSTAFSP